MLRGPNGPGWVAVRLRSADQVLSLKVDYAVLKQIKLGVVGAYPSGSPCQFEVRAFYSTTSGFEDPVTGSLNAGLAQWLIGSGLAPRRYLASQGTALGRAGRVHIEQDAQSNIWVGGESVTCIEGMVRL